MLSKGEKLYLPDKWRQIKLHRQYDFYDFHDFRYDFLWVSTLKSHNDKWRHYANLSPFYDFQDFLET